MIQQVKTMVGALALLAVATAGAQAQEWKDSPAVKALYEQAKAEGEAVIWGPQEREVEWIPDAFAKRFPGITVKWTADLGSGTKLIAEARAGRHQVDVFHFSLGGMIPVQQRDLLGTADWKAFGVAPADVFFNGAAGATHNLIYSIAYNEQRVSAADAPKTWSDLLDPRWKGQLAASQFLLPRFLGFLALEWGEDRAAEFGRALIDDQNTLITRAPREGMLASGERLIAVGEFVGAATFWKKTLNMPIAWRTMEIVPAVQFVAAPLAKAPHPNAAKLLAAWMASEDAKTAREAYSFEADIRPGSKSEQAAAIRATGAKIIYEDLSNMKARAESYERLSKLIRGQ